MKLNSPSYFLTTSLAALPILYTKIQMQIWKKNVRCIGCLLAGKISRSIGDALELCHLAHYCTAAISQP